MRNRLEKKLATFSSLTGKDGQNKKFERAISFFKRNKHK